MIRAEEVTSLHGFLDFIKAMFQSSDSGRGIHSGRENAIKGMLQNEQLNNLQWRDLTIKFRNTYKVKQYPSPADIAELLDGVKAYNKDVKSNPVSDVMEIVRSRNYTPQQIYKLVKYYRREMPINGQYCSEQQAASSVSNILQWMFSDMIYNIGVLVDAGESKEVIKQVAQTDYETIMSGGSVDLLKTDKKIDIDCNRSAKVRTPEQLTDEMRSPAFAKSYPAEV